MIDMAGGAGDAGMLAGHGAAMDAQYRWQRHVYDLTRKYYLLGRDDLIRALDMQPGERLLEIGCGTGRNLALAGRLYPAARLYGVDISAEMLKNAQRTLRHAVLARGDATAFDASTLLGHTDFDRIFISYALSMIPDWQGAVDQAARLVAPGGRLHIVDFGQQEDLPRWFGAMLTGWLARFHVTPRSTLFDVCADIGNRHGLTVTSSRLYRGYAWGVALTRPLAPPVC